MKAFLVLCAIICVAVNKNEVFSSKISSSASISSIFCAFLASRSIERYPQLRRGETKKILLQLNRCANLMKFLKIFLKNGMDELSAKIPGLKPWLESHREEFLSLFHDYHECSQKSTWKKMLVN